jgi:predicted nucleotidyltransferase component of viral defense system
MATRLSLVVKKPEELFLDRLPLSARNAFLYCADELKFLSESNWYLAGGTALTLQVGHRQSMDLDFFLPNVDFDRVELERKLIATKKWNTSFIQKGTIYGTLLKAKMGFIAYPFFKPSSHRITCSNIKILTPNDIAVMKIIAISQRGRKRDFVDLYWYAKNKKPVFDVIQRAIHQYPGQEENLNHILKSLLYFEDAEDDPMPILFFEASWKEVKEYFLQEIPRITKEFLGLK